MGRDTFCILRGSATEQKPKSSLAHSLLAFHLPSYWPVMPRTILFTSSCVKLPVIRALLPRPDMIIGALTTLPSTKMASGLFRCSSVSLAIFFAPDSVKVISTTGCCWSSRAALASAMSSFMASADWCR